MRTKGETEKDRRGLDKKSGHTFLSPQEERCCATGIPMVCVALRPDGVSSSALWRKLGWGSPCSPVLWAVGLGCGLWLPRLSLTPESRQS